MRGRMEVQTVVTLADCHECNKAMAKSRSLRVGWGTMRLVTNYFVVILLGLSFVWVVQDWESISQSNVLYVMIFILVALVAALLFLLVVYKSIQQRSMDAFYEGLVKTACVVVNEKGIAQQSEDRYLFVGWTQVRMLLVTNGLYIFITKSNIIIFFNKKFVEQQSDFENLMAQYLTGKTIEYVKC